jgi:hypothetical protein
MLTENATRIALIAELPTVTDELAQHFEGAQWRAGGGSEYLDDPAVVNARLDDVVGAAEWEILSAQPGGPRDEVQLNRSVARDSQALGRGVVKRTLYRATVRDNAVTARYAREMGNRPVGRSAEFRTLVGSFERCIIVDRKIGVHFEPSGGGCSGAFCVAGHGPGDGCLHCGGVRGEMGSRGSVGW